MKTWIFIGISSVVIIGLFVLAYSLSGSTAQTPVSSGQPVALPVAGSVGQQVNVTPSSGEGGLMQTNDFLKDPTTVQDPFNAGYYFLGYHPNEGVPDPTASENPPYLIVYIGATQYFNISLLEEPIGSVREDAQNYLATRLGISEDQMCGLNYMVSVPNRVNSQFSGRNLGFSFCSGATPLPK